MPQDAAKRYGSARIWHLDRDQYIGDLIKSYLTDILLPSLINYCIEVAYTFKPTQLLHLHVTGVSTI